MAYIRPCNKCGQRISMREMKAGQWVAFDSSTDKAHKCGKKNKADPNIKKLAKEKLKKNDSEGIDLGYSYIESRNTSSENIDEINFKIEETYKEALNTESTSQIEKEIIPQIINKEDNLSQKYIKKDPPVFSDGDNIILKIVGALILAGFLFGLFSS